MVVCFFFYIVHLFLSCPFLSDPSTFYSSSPFLLIFLLFLSICLVLPFLSVLLYFLSVLFSFFFIFPSLPCFVLWMSDFYSLENVVPSCYSLHLFHCFHFFFFLFLFFYVLLMLSLSKFWPHFWAATWTGFYHQVLLGCAGKRRISKNMAPKPGEPISTVFVGFLRGPVVAAGA